MRIEDQLGKIAMVTEAGSEEGEGVLGEEHLEAGDLEEEDVGKERVISMLGPFSEAFYLENIFLVLRKSSDSPENAHKCSHMWSTVSRPLQI